MMASWGWPPAQMEYALPTIREACVQAGILVPLPDGYALTPLVHDDDAWERVWTLLKEKGIGEEVS